ncbi:MAG: hypothetical protein BWY68_00670 [bacterium ADurb.Bin400]|nr:MAG: hypothetical protein BWY68_00670 [bacterium ADurb.Bin400]
MIADIVSTALILAVFPGLPFAVIIIGTTLILKDLKKSNFQKQLIGLLLLLATFLFCYLMGYWLEKI